MTLRTKIIIGVSILGVGVGVWLIGNKKNWWTGKGTERDEDENVDDKDNDSTDETSTPSRGDNSFPLRRGDRGDNVAILQQYLNYSKGRCEAVKPAMVARTLPKLKVDGIFGKKTEDLVKLCDYGSGGGAKGKSTVSFPWFVSMHKLKQSGHLN